MALVSRNRVWVAAFVAGALLLTLGGGAVVFSNVKRVAPVSWGLYGDVNHSAGVAIGGYDVVAYRQGAPSVGRVEFSMDYEGATWHFESQSHLDSFVAAPGTFVPQFGGYCAFAVSKGFTAASDPTVFAVRDERLYLFDSAPFREQWLADYAVNEGLSSSNWRTRVPASQAR